LAGRPVAGSVSAELSRRAAALRVPDIQVGTPNHGKIHFIKTTYASRKMNSVSKSLMAKLPAPNVHPLAVAVLLTSFICCPQQISEWACVPAGQGHAFS
jgi:hypothetical protein